MYYSDRGGLILAADLVDLFCVYGGDGNSMGHDCGGGYGNGVTCIPGCYPRGQQCQEVGHDWNCAWPPTRLADAMEAQLLRGRPSASHNEIVIDTRSIERNMPSVVLAYFYLDDAGVARRERAAFHRAFADWSVNVPLIRINLGGRGGGDPVFRLASDLSA